MNNRQRQILVAFSVSMGLGLLGGLAFNVTSQLIRPGKIDLESRIAGRACASSSWRCLSRTQAHPIQAVLFLLEVVRLSRRISSPVDCIVSERVLFAQSFQKKR